MLLADIGGGSLEVALGPDRLPDVALSLRLGARELTRQFLGGGDPPPARAVSELRCYVREQIDRVADRAYGESPATAVATSKTFCARASCCAGWRPTSRRWRTRARTSGDRWIGAPSAEA